jgi:hypothetical protein
VYKARLSSLGVYLCKARSYMGYLAAECQFSFTACSKRMKWQRINEAYAASEDIGGLVSHP